MVLLVGILVETLSTRAQGGGDDEFCVGPCLLLRSDVVALDSRSGLQWSGN